jgi:hypothetical protein
VAVFVTRGIIFAAAAAALFLILKCHRTTLARRTLENRAAERQIARARRLMMRRERITPPAIFVARAV